MEKETKILIVEDEAVVRHDLLQTLHESGDFLTDHTPSGTEALKKARDFKPDLILMDIMLQNGIDGIKIANQINKQFDIPVIYISAFSDTYLLKRAKVTQPYGYIIKPYNTRELLISIEMALYKHEMEKKLKTSEVKFRSIFENANDSIISLDKDGKIVDVNQMALKIFGLKKRSVLGVSFRDLDFFVPADIQRFEDYLKHIFQGSDSNLEVSVKNKKGKIFCLEFSATEMKISDNIEQIVIIARDITERKRVEHELTKYREQLEKLVQKRTVELNRSNKRLEKDVEKRKKVEEEVKKERDFISSVLDTAAALMVVLDKTGKVVRFNRACIRTSGYSFQEVKGKHVWDFLIVLDDIKRIKENFSKSHSGLLIKEEEHSWVTKDGSIRLISWAQTRINDSHGQLEYVILIGIDITERRQTEEAFRESEKLAAQGRMAAGIAHEINNPLGGIKNAFLLIKDAVPTDHQYYRYIDRIDSEIHRIAQIVHSMYDIYKPSKELSSEFSLKHLIRDVVSLLDSESRSQRIKITSSLTSKKSLVHLPRGYVTQVLYNLIKNAVEASDKDGLVKIKTTMNEDRLRISVSDEGIGISKEDYSNIFEPFYSTKHQLKTGGLGLGLSVSRSLIEAMSGKLTFNSQIGKGTTFIAILPLSLPHVEIIR